MHIEFLYWHQCPSHEVALARLHKVLKEEGVSPTIDVMHVGTEEDAVAKQFPGSPTIRINGTDIAPPPTGVKEYNLTCRAYLSEDGQISPLPTKESMRRAIRNAREREVRRQKPRRS